MLTVIMEHDLPEWIRRIGLRFISERPRLLNEPLPKRITEALAALEDAEHRRSAEVAGDKDASHDPARREPPDRPPGLR